MSIMQNAFGLFDNYALSRFRRRSAKNLKDFLFLSETTAASLTGRLNDINRSYECAVLNGHGELAHEKIITALRTGQDFIYDERILPVENACLDLFLSNLTLHAIHDLPGLLVQIRNALKPDGLFLAAMPGGETLYELRDSLMQAELRIKGGASPRVYPFADKRQTGTLLQRAGFALPVVDSEIIKVTYPDIYALMRDLRGMGESNALTARDRRNPGKELFRTANDYYKRRYPAGDGRIEATFEVIYLIGWKPHESQQKPLRPGSAKERLADTLGADETKVKI